MFLEIIHHTEQFFWQHKSLDIYSSRLLYIADLFPDNYQGEESDIVLVSMTRSNSRNDIGFMSQPQRLNVLVSRARNALIMVGNSDTFINARKGKEIWKKFFDFLSAAGHVYQGLPVRCENHPDRIINLAKPEDFENHCPDGGCKETW